jgi:hypothetical protein
MSGWFASLNADGTSGQSQRLSLAQTSHVEQRCGVATRATCPCCGHRSLPDGPGAYEVCPVCLWEDDGTPTGPYGVGGPNGYSLVYGQRRYLREHRAHHDSPPGYSTRPPREDEPRDPDWTPHPDSLRNDLVLGWTSRQQTVTFLSQVAALTGSPFSEADAATIAGRLPATNVYYGKFLEWRPGDSSGVNVQVAVAPGDDDVTVRVDTDGDANLAERLREVLENAL